MNYKEIIWKLRYCILDADDVEQAAFAIETLLAEREAAMKFLLKMQELLTDCSARVKRM